MGCSARRLSRTRSGTVRSRFIAAGILRLSLPAPVPPLALRGGKERVPRLCHGGAEDILAAYVYFPAGLPTHDAAEFAVEPDRVLPRQLLYAADAEQLKVA